MELKDWIRAARASAALTQERLGDLLGVTKGNISAWENARHEPSFGQLQRIAHVTGYTLPSDLNLETTESKAKNVAPSVPAPLITATPLNYSVKKNNFKEIPVIGRGKAGVPERIWTDGDFPMGASDEYAEIASADPQAFLTPVIGRSMVPRFNPGEFAFVEPGTAPEPGDDVLVRLSSGGTMIKRLVSTRGGMIELYSYNEAEQEPLFFRAEEITWMYYIAHPVPARKIKTRL